MSARSILACLTVAALASLLAPAASAAEEAYAGRPYVDGISDQQLGSWSGTYLADGFAQPFPEFASRTWIESTPARFRYARYVVPWNITANRTSSCFTRFQAWLAETRRLGLVPVVSLWTYSLLYGRNVCAPTSPELPRSTSEYGTRLGELLALAPPGAIPYVEAWNEPNATRPAPPDFAAVSAGLWGEAESVCHTAANACSAIAGDFIDTPGLDSWETAYERALPGCPAACADPGDWGIHPYRAVNTAAERDESYPPPRDSTAGRFLELLPDRGAGRRLWFTEVGAYRCKDGRELSEAQQRRAAEYLVRQLIPALRPLHTFYYQFAEGIDEPPHCSDLEHHREDDALYAPAAVDEAQLPRAAAAVVLASEPRGIQLETFPAGGAADAGTRLLDSSYP